ncbi:hypothetical protein ACXIZN_25525 [Amycolatopsis sp. TRM77291]
MIMGIVVGLTFLFGFGNVLNLALRLGVPVWVAPLVAPAVDLSILGLLLGIRHLVLIGVSQEGLKPARRLLVFSSVVTLALNVAEPLMAGEFGKAAFDAVGPLLLIGWSEVGPGLLQTLGAPSREPVIAGGNRPEPRVAATSVEGLPGTEPQLKNQIPRDCGERAADRPTLATLLAQAKREDAAHRTAHQKPISADALRVRLRVGSARARQLVKIVRAEFEALSDQGHAGLGADKSRAAVTMAGRIDCAEA